MRSNQRFWRRFLNRARKVLVGTVGRDTITQIVRRTRSGVRIDEDRALGIAAVFACVRILSDAVAIAPWRLYLARHDAGRQLLSNDPLDRMLHIRPNSEMTAMQWKATTVSHALLWGNGYSEIETNRRGDGVGLWILPPDRVTPIRDTNNRLVYEVTESAGKTTVLPAAKVFHLRGLGFDGLLGYSVIRTARECLGVAMAAESFGASFFGAGAKFGGFVKLDGVTLDETAKDGLSRQFNDAEKHGRTIILPTGVDWKPNSMPPDDAQFLQTRKFQVEEVARFFGIPPHKIQSLERATFDNIEHQAIEFVQDAVLPWVVRLEQEADFKLLDNPRRVGQYSKMNLDALLRGDTRTRYEAYRVGRHFGWLSANDVRRMEDMNPIPDGGNEYIVQVNMIPERLLGNNRHKPSGDNGDALTEAQQRRIAERFHQPVHE